VDRPSYSRACLAKEVDGLCAQASASGPPDLGRLAVLRRVREIRLEPMLPSGTLSPSAGGFVLCVRSERRSVFHPPAFPPDLDPRQRFTFAHELAHTFFYDLGADPPVPKRGAPKGGRLEGLCHFMAGRILLPEAVLQERLGQCERVGADFVLALSRDFQVSPEAVVRRLAQADKLPDSDCGLALVESGGAREADRVVASFFCEGLARRVISRPRAILPLYPWLCRTLSRKAAKELWGSDLWLGGTVTIGWGDNRLVVRHRPCSAKQYFLELHLAHADDPETVELYDDSTLPLWRPPPRR